MRRLSPLLAVVLVAVACSSGTPTPPSASPGLLTGVVVSHPSQGDHRTPLANARIGVYSQEVSSGGPVMQNPPQPVMTTTTDGDGVFTFHGLPAGRWFVLAIGQAGKGTWVRYDPAVGASITLVVCSDCAIPL